MRCEQGVMGSWFWFTTWILLGTGSAPDAPAVAVALGKPVAAASPAGPAASAKERLLNLLSAPDSTTEERIAVARLAGLGRWQVHGLPEMLSRCAMTNRPEAASCIMALVARGEVEQLPVIRESLRRATDPAVVAAGCTALSAFQDGHSRSLVMSAILRQKGGELGGIACAGALDRLNKWTNARYELFAWRFLTHPVLRNFMAMQVLRHTTQANRGAIQSDLMESARQLLGPAALSVTEAQALALAVCALSQSGKGISVTAQEKLDPLLRGLPPGSPGKCAVCQLAVELCGVQYPTCAIPPTGCVDPKPPKQPLPLREKIRALKLEGLWHFTNAQWDEVLLHSPRVRALGLDGEALSALLELPKQAKRRLASFWSVDVLLDSAAPRKPRPIPWAEFHKRFAHETFPDSFLAFEPALKQPAWLDPNLVLTVDDGPSLVNLPGILDAFEKHQVKGVFFFVGVNIISHYASHPDSVRKLLQRLLDGGHVIAYHTMEHALSWPNHIVYWDLDQVTDDVELFKMVLALASGRSAQVVYGRSPGGTGTYMGTLRKAFQVSGLLAPVGWNREFRSHVGLGEVYGSAQALATNPVKAVVLMHEYFSTPKVIDYFLTTYQNNRKKPTPAPAE